jgi:hypothetical protein
MGRADGLPREHQAGFSHIRTIRSEIKGVDAATMLLGRNATAQMAAARAAPPRETGLM